MLKMNIIILLSTVALGSCTEYVYDQDILDYNDQDSAMGSSSNELTSAKSTSTKRTTTTKNITSVTTEMETKYSKHQKVVIWSETENDTEIDSAEVTDAVKFSKSYSTATHAVKISTHAAATTTEPAASTTTERESFHTSAHEAPTSGPHSENSEEDNDDTITNYPFSVSLQRKGAHYTTGALLDKRWILTVAGEFYNVRESIKLFRARLGSIDCKKGGTLVPLKRLEIHPLYEYGQPNFDLALLRMAQPVDYTDYIRPIGISNIESKVRNAKFMTTYWPRLIVRGHVLPPTAKERVKHNSMRVSTQRLIPQDKCISLSNMQNVTLDDSTLCLKPVVSHHSQCLPDAGAPVVAEDGLWGITSGWTSNNCDTFPSPTVFSRLSSTPVRSWLDTQLLSL